MSNDAGCEGGPRGKDVCVHIADSLCCAEEMIIMIDFDLVQVCL